jgi:hypothetical protein
MKYNYNWHYHLNIEDNKALKEKEVGEIAVVVLTKRG